ncbi:hypothetical protein [Streptomyces hoynatensis]|uniref:Uncharacterized protein n=1 Tax=Streptomyces hoynatensis TaxID=1141874 RepID=A0A3A9YQ76_9ACTN|nr:hypothetical protein [Streptomyces hoynatensis]RKN37396.1 hypothetical protein D7294_28070 [Streptomyces hoynatensis]
MVPRSTDPEEHRPPRSRPEPGASREGGGPPGATLPRQLVKRPLAAAPLAPAPGGPDARQRHRESVERLRRDFGLDEEDIALAQRWADDVVNRRTRLSLAAYLATRGPR